jgi:hypothetical protein
MATWRLYTYDVWGNEEDGFEVNDVFRTDTAVDVESEEDEKNTESAILSETRELYTCNPEIDNRAYYGEKTIVVNDLNDGAPLCEWRLES